jgi:DNA-binding SARP family transcriptional activator
MAGIIDTSDVRAATRKSRWRLDLLGAWRLTGSGDDVLDVGVNGRRIYALVALRGRCDRPYLAGTLWPECSEAHAHGNLRAALSRLHRRGLAGPLDLSANGVLALRPEVEVDVRGVAAVARAVLDDDPTTTPKDAVRRLTCEDLLLGWYDDWVLLERERLRQLRLHALERLSGQLLAAGDVARAVEAALEAVAVEPLRESAHAALIRAHLAEGNRAEAARQLQRLRKLLRKELNEEPSPLVTGLLQ